MRNDLVLYAMVEENNLQTRLKSTADVLAVKKIDPRIHCALVCASLSCSPINFFIILAIIVVFFIIKYFDNGCLLKFK